MRLFTITCLLIFIHSIAYTQDGLTPESAMEAYQKGLQSFQTQEYEDAKNFFQYAWEKSPKSALSLYNWGLAEHKLGNQGMALAAWRKALFLSPGLKPVKEAMEFLFANSSLPGLQRNQNHWETFRESVLIRFSFQSLFAMTLILFLISGWKAIQYFGQRYLAIEKELSLPGIPWSGAFFLVLFLGAVSLIGLKVFDYTNPRATVIQQTATVRSAPTASSSSLFEIYEGAEVLLKRKQPQWSQVKYPGGLTGWVENQSLFHTSGQEL